MTMEGDPGKAGLTGATSHRADLRRSQPGCVLTTP